jgi:hypothetical protein
MKNKNAFAVGSHRPVYLWGGPGTVRMNQLKFMEAPVDEAVHAEAHTAVGALRMKQEADFNWAYLMYDWGFPPEVEQEDWEDFARAVQIYHVTGIRVFGYVQTSNCVYAGSYRDKDWYALDPKGQRIYYYTGRYMTCWSHPTWLAHLREMVKGIVDAGAEGVFFDNPWHGAQPLHIKGAWLGPVGCYCERCQAAFRQDTGLEAIPKRISPDIDEASQRYLRWRAKQVTQTMHMLAEYARSLNPDIVISANDFDAVMRPSYLIYGIDLQALAEVQDVIMIEDFALPRWKSASSSDKPPQLVNNALTMRTARALIKDTPLSVDPYDKGIGFDHVYPPRRFQQGIAEAAACGATMVVKGTEYVEDGVFTLLTAECFTAQREAIGELHRWLSEQAHLYQQDERENAATVGLLFSSDAFWQRWDQLAPLYFGVGQTLLNAGIAWRVVTLDDRTPSDDVSNLDVLFHFTDFPSEYTEADAADLNIVDVRQLEGWTPPAPSKLAHRKLVRAVLTRIVTRLYRAYFERRWARRLGDHTGMVQAFLQSPHFNLPPRSARQAVLDALGEQPYPHVTSKNPVLLEHWKQREQQQLHLVNYAATPQSVTVHFQHPVKGQILSPEHTPYAFEGPQINVDVEVYSVLLY